MVLLKTSAPIGLHSSHAGENNQHQRKAFVSYRLSEAEMRFNELLKWLSRNKLNLPHKIVVIVPGHTDKTLRDHGINFLVRFSNGVRMGFVLLKSTEGLGRRARKPEQTLEGITIVNMLFDFEKVQRKLSHAAEYVVKLIMKPLIKYSRRLAQRMRRAQRLQDPSRRESCPRPRALFGYQC